MEKVSPAATNPLVPEDIGIFYSRCANEKPFRIACEQFAARQEDENESEERFQASLLVQIRTEGQISASLISINRIGTNAYRRRNSLPSTIIHGFVPSKATMASKTSLRFSTKGMAIRSARKPGLTVPSMPP